MVAARTFFAPPEGHRARPRVIRRLMHRVQDYYDNPATLPSLLWAPVAGRERQRPMYEPRRAACVTVLQALLHYVDLMTLRIGARGDEVVGVKLATIAEQCGLCDRRVDRVIRDLRAAGILRSYARSELRGDQRIGHASLRVILRDLWQAFGLGDELAKERRKASHSRKRPAPTRRGRARARLSYAGILGRFLDPP